MGGPHPTEARSASAEHQVVIGSRYCKSAWLVSRGVNDGLSGLFGRFAARAHHEGYFNVSIFAYLGGRGIDLDRLLFRLLLPHCVRGKGCHDPDVPARRLQRPVRGEAAEAVPTALQGGQMRQRRSGFTGRLWPGGATDPEVPGWRRPRRL